MFPHSPATIHALPVELLTRIIVLGAEDDDPYQRSPFLLKPDQNYYAIPSTQFQLTASHVCQHWRHVALRTPSLWTTLCFRELCHIPRAHAYLARCIRNPNCRLDILVDTVAPQDHIPGVTIYLDELIMIFSLIMPHVASWRAFHLKIRDNDCKLLARQNLGGSCPAPNLETLQLYHFEDFRAPRDLYIATYRPPVRIFSNFLPKLRNVSLIGVNLPWQESPYLLNLHTLELALHSDSIRPPYKSWDSMLRHSPHLRRLFLTYSGPRNENGTEELTWTAQEDGKGKRKEDDCIVLENLWELSLTDLDPDYLCLVLSRLVMPNVEKLSLDLPDQDFTPFVELIAPRSGHPVDPLHPPTSLEESHSEPRVHHSYDSTLEFSSSSSQGGFPLTNDHPSPSLSSSSSETSSTPVHLSQSLSTSNTSTSILPASPISPLSPFSLSTVPVTATTAAPTTATPSNSTNSSPTLSHSGFFKRTPLPKLATTLQTLIITALECDSPSWTTLIRSLVALEVLEVNFSRVTITGVGTEVIGRKDWVAWSALVGEVVEEVNVDGQGAAVGVGVRRERMVLPRLRRCKMAGLSGSVVREIVARREGGGGDVRGVEWLVVEDKYSRDDQELAAIFEKGVWVNEGEDERRMYWKGRWVKVQRVLEEEEGEEEEEEDEDEGEDEDEEVEEGDGVEDGDEAEEEEGGERISEVDDDDDDEVGIDNGEDDLELQDSVSATGSYLVGPGTDKISASVPNSDSGATIRSSRRSDIHRGMA